MIVRERFSIAELVSRTGVPAATVHHYRRLGLLPAARRAASNRFLYDERHVQALRLIRVLRERRRLSLKSIRSILPDLVGLEDEQAFRPEMWDKAVGLHVRGARRTPAARLLAAGKEIFARRSYGDVNVEEICKQARIAKGSFYRHFRSKEELFFAAAESASGDVLKAYRAATGGHAVSEETAAASLAASIQPALPIFLDLVARALQRRPGYRSAARTVLGGLAEEVGRLVRGSHDPRATGLRVVLWAVAAVLEDTLELPAGRHDEIALDTHS